MQITKERKKKTSNLTRINRSPKSRCIQVIWFLPQSRHIKSTVIVWISLLDITVSKLLALIWKYTFVCGKLSTGWRSFWAYANMYRRRMLWKCSACATSGIEVLRNFEVFPCPWHGLANSAFPLRWQFRSKLH